MITLYRRGKVFWAQSSAHGTQRKWSLHTRDRAVAQELVRQAELEHLSASAFKQKRWLEFEKEFLQAVAQDVAPHTYKEYARVLKLFSDFAAGRGIAFVKECEEAGVISAYTDIRSKAVHRINRRPMTAGGLKFELRILHRVFANALELGFVARNPVRARNLNSVAGKTLPFTLDEVRRMTSSPYLESKPYLKAVVLLFLHSGLRITDVIHLKRFSIASGILHLKTQKRDKLVRFPLHPDVLAALKKVPAHRGSSYVFTTENGKPIISLDKHLRRLWKRCEIQGGHAHRFRDTFAVNLLEKGASLYDVAKLLGISHQTAERHYSPYVKELQERGARLVQSVDYNAAIAASG